MDAFDVLRGRVVIARSTEVCWLSVISSVLSSSVAVVEATNCIDSVAVVRAKVEPGPNTPKRPDCGACVKVSQGESR
jgi:hypothetical protein